MLESKSAWSKIHTEMQLVIVYSENALTSRWYRLLVCLLCFIVESVVFQWQAPFWFPAIQFIDKQRNFRTALPVLSSLLSGADLLFEFEGYSNNPVTLSDRCVLVWSPLRCLLWLPSLSRPPFVHLSLFRSPSASSSLYGAQMGPY